MNKLLQVITDWLFDCLLAMFEDDYEEERVEVCPYMTIEDWDRVHGR